MDFSRQNPKEVIVIYHGNCADGFGAAWVCRKAFAENRLYKDQPAWQHAEFYPGVYQKAPPNVKDKMVYIVDFSYKRPIMVELLNDAAGVVIIDHHASAISDLSDLVHPRLTSYFDVKHSGAMLAWLFFFGEGQPPPELLKIIEHRDLWKFSTPPTDYDNLVRQVQANLFSYPYDFDVWDMLMTEAQSEEKLDNLSSEGAAIERKHFKDIKELLKVGQRRAIIAGFDVPVANLPYTLSSDAGHIMDDGEPFAACYMDTPKGRIFSLRSRAGKGIDVSEIAKKYGGGGHPNAAGFEISHDQLELIPFVGSGVK